MDVTDHLEEELRELDGEAETGNASPPAKHRKVKQKVLQQYRAEYAVKYPVIRRSSLSEMHAVLHSLRHLTRASDTEAYKTLRNTLLLPSARPNNTQAFPHVK